MSWSDVFCFLIASLISALIVVVLMYGLTYDFSVKSAVSDGDLLKLEYFKETGKSDYYGYSTWLENYIKDRKCGH